MQGGKEILCLAFCSFFILVLSCLDTLPNTEIFRNSGFRGLSKIPPVFSTTAATKEVCSIACVRHTACKSFSFRSGTEGCSLFSRRIMALDVDLSVPSEDAHFFRVLESCPAWKGYDTVPGTNKCIRVEKVKKTWPEAADDCVEDGGHLLIVENADVMQKLLDFLPQGKYIVGFTDEDKKDKYIWLDRTPVDRTMFYATEPSDHRTGGKEDCGMLWVKVKYPGLHDYVCHVAQMFICSLLTEE